MINLGKMNKNMHVRRQGLPTIIMTPAPPQELDMLLKVKSMRSEYSNGENDRDEHLKKGSNIEYMIEEEISYVTKRTITYRERPL